MIEQATPSARTISGIDFEEPELHPLGYGLAAVYTNRAPEKETVNEDSAAIIPYDEHSGILVVADGAGGLPSGAKASEIAVKSLRKSLAKGKEKGVSLRACVLDAIERANTDVLELGIGAATTLAVAEIYKDSLRSYIVGDSQITQIGQRGKLKMQTISHSPVGYQVEAGIIDDDEALLHEERHLVSNLIGAQDMRVEITSPMSIAPKDTVIIASDGVYDNLTSQEIIEICRKGPLLSACRQLVEQCRLRMTQPGEGEPSKPDDLTIIAYRRRLSS